MKYTLPRPVLTSLSQFVADKLGLNFPQEKWNDLEQAIKEISRLNHFDDPMACIHWIMHSLSCPLQVEILANHLTIGETYFFREKGCFEALKNYILPALIEQRKNMGKTIRIWSAPCSSGEEPYTIAMLLSMMIPNIHEWNITILASDVNEVALSRMKEGIYTDWSFRETLPYIKDRFFTKIKNNRYEINQKIKNMVTPLYLNLSQDCFPDIVNGTNAMDLILCRNMLMYFVQEHRTQVINQFYTTLVNDGYLVVGASEVALVQNKMFTIVNYPGAIFYKKDLSKVANENKPQILLYPVESSDWILPSHDEPIREVVSTEPIHFTRRSRIIKAIKKTEPKKMLLVEEHTVPMGSQFVEQKFRELANQGKLNAALAFIEKSIRVGRFNPLYYFYKALLLLELGEADKATLECKNAIYLNPDFILPYFVLGNISQRNGKIEESKRYYKTVLMLLKDSANEDILPGSEGLSVQRMKEIIQSIQGYTHIY